MARDFHCYYQSLALANLQICTRLLLVPKIYIVLKSQHAGASEVNDASEIQGSHSLRLLYVYGELLKPGEFTESHRMVGLGRGDLWIS